MTKLLALAALVAATTAQAGEISPLSAGSITLADTAGTVYYTKEAQGFRVVATISGEVGTQPVRFTALLGDGQSIVVSVPLEDGKAAKEVEILRTGDTLSIDDVAQPMIRASLD